MDFMTLAHHGIKGQKWGVRRWQNEDGSLTPEGKARYQVSNLSDDSFVIKKGSSVYRVANQDEVLSKNKARYYSLTDDDRFTYSGELMKGLFYDHNKPVGEFTNSLKDDITVKKGTKVIADLIHDYGGTRVDELSKNWEDEKNFRTRFQDRESRDFYLDDVPEDFDEFEKQLRYDAARDNLSEFIWDTMKVHSDDIERTYREKGYDAIVDPYDYLKDIADMPIIMLDPASSVSQESFRKLGY